MSRSSISNKTQTLVKSFFILLFSQIGQLEVEETFNGICIVFQQQSRRRRILHFIRRPEVKEKNSQARVGPLVVLDNLI